MLILLPPSEGKTVPESGAPLELDGLAFDSTLRGIREDLLDRLERLASGDLGRALAALGISERQTGEVERNGLLRSTPAAAAAEVYTGVLYERLALGKLSSSARSRASEQVLVTSALWGMIRVDDRIPAYRLSAGAKLPGLGGLAAHWRSALAEAMEAAGHDAPGRLVLDARSGAYASFWKPAHAGLIPIRAFEEAADGSRKAVSHMAKAVRGDVARVVLESGRDVDDLDSVAAILTEAGFRVDVLAGSLDLIFG